MEGSGGRGYIAQVAGSDGGLPGREPLSLTEVPVVTPALAACAISATESADAPQPMVPARRRRPLPSAARVLRCDAGPSAALGQMNETMRLAEAAEAEAEAAAKESTAKGATLSSADRRR